MKNKIYFHIFAFCIMSIYAQQDGTFDPLFATNGQLISSFEPAFAIVANGIQIQQDSKIVIAGRRNTTGFFVARYLVDGTTDSSFGVQGFVFTTIPQASSISGSDMVIDPDGKILVSGGGIAAAGNHNIIVVARYNTDGSLDTTFGGTNTGYIVIDTGVIGDVRQRAMIAIKKNGNIVIATSVGLFGSASQALLAELLPNGTLNQSFGINGLTAPDLFGGTSIQLFQVKIQEDQNIIVIGNLTDNTRSATFFVARYTANGALDTSFNAIGYVATSVNGGSTAGAAGGSLQADGKILAYGSDNANPPLYIVRYHTDGSLDESFATKGIGSYAEIGNIVTPSSLAVQTDGKIVVEAGAVVGGNNALGVMRANIDGSIDDSFGQNGMAITTQILNTASGQSQPRALCIDATGDITALAVVANNSVGIVRYEVDSLKYSDLSLANWRRYYNQN